MTDEQIIKVLQRCFIVGSCSGCTGCPLKPKRQEDANCIDKLVTNTIDLIKRQQAEIERLSVYNEEIVNRIRKSAIKEFAERLKEKISKPWYYLAQIVFVKEDIDELVKEMGYGNGKS